MQLDKLTDDLIQSYLDDTLSDDEREQVERLLASDEAARTQLVTYKSLYSHLSIDDGFELSDKFSDAVMERAMPSLKHEWMTAAIWILSSIAGLIGVTAAIVLVDWGWINTAASPVAELAQKIWTKVAAVTLPSIDLMGTLVNPTAALIEELNGAFFFIVAAGMILLVVKSVDSLLLHNRYDR